VEGVCGGGEGMGGVPHTHPDDFIPAMGALRTGATTRLVSVGSVIDQPGRPGLYHLAAAAKEAANSYKQYLIQATASKHFRFSFALADPDAFPQALAPAESLPNVGVSMRLPTMC